MSCSDPIASRCRTSTVELNGTPILVAGATGVLGSAIATELSARGAKLALTGRNAQRLAALGEELDAPVARLDLTEPGTIAACVRDSAAALGGLDALVIATGVVAFGPEPELGADVVRELFAVNATGPIALVGAALEHFGDHGHDRRAQRRGGGAPDRRAGRVLGQQGRAVRVPGGAAAGAPSLRSERSGRAPVAPRHALRDARARGLAAGPARSGRSPCGRGADRRCDARRSARARILAQGAHAGRALAVRELGRAPTACAAVPARACFWWSLLRYGRGVQPAAMGPKRRLSTRGSFSTKPLA